MITLAACTIFGTLWFGGGMDIDFQADSRHTRQCDDVLLVREGPDTLHFSRANYLVIIPLPELQPGRNKFRYIWGQTHAEVGFETVKVELLMVTSLTMMGVCEWNP